MYMMKRANEITVNIYKYIFEQENINPDVIHQQTIISGHQCRV